MTPDKDRKADKERKAAMPSHQMPQAPEGHDVLRSEFGTFMELRCTCGWRHRERIKQNALARASKLRGAEAQHYREMVSRDAR
jgi:hypothetical protein